MATIRNKKQKNPYTSISRVLLQDPKLTFEARGLASYVLSKPDNWEIDVDALIRESPAGRDAIYHMIRELCVQGYLIREKYRERGKFQYRYTLYESKELAAHHTWLADEQPSLFDPYGKPILKSRTGAHEHEPDSAPDSHPQPPEDDPEPPESANQCGKPVLETSPDNQCWKPVLETSTEKPYWSCKEEQTTEQSSEQISEQTTEQTTESPPDVVVVCEFSEEEVLAYARGQTNIASPVGFTKSVRDGTAKDLPRILQSIGEWLRSHAPPDSDPADIAEIEMPGELVPELLEAFLVRLRDGMVNPTSFHKWFAPIEAMSRGDTAVYLRVPDASFAGWIAQYYGEIVEETLAEIGLTGYRFEFVIKRE
jgi:hypothetical protein